MSTYFFRSKNITEAQVKTIISTAGYNIGDYIYDAMVSRDGWVVDGIPVMNINRLERAAKDKKIKVEISSPPGRLVTRDEAMPLGAGTPYQVTVTMSPTTVTTLLASNFILYGFKAVQSASAGTPLVWFQTESFSANTVVSWTEQYQAYTSTSTIIPDGEIVASFSAPINLGQQMNVSAGGLGTVVGGGPATAISILNTTSTPYTTGVSQVTGGVAQPICAFPLYGNNEDVIAPIEKVLLMFSTIPVNTGTVIEQSYGPGLLIDLTASNQRTVSYDINAGWSWGGYNWAQQIPASSDLIPLLIDDSVQSSQMVFQPRSLISA